MLLGEPQRTQGDVNFTFLGFPVRISVWFWVGAIFLGWNSSDQADPSVRFRNLMIWTIAVFVSILIHELGHAMAFRKFGVRSHIVLYHLGGLAVPDSSVGYQRNSRDQIFISAAGPMLQIATAIVLMMVIAFSGHFVPIGGFAAKLFMLPEGGVDIPNESMRLFSFFYLYVSIYWAFMNLLPVYPLDGGQIARELFLMYDRRDPIKHSLILSMATAGLIALFAFQRRETYLGFMFFILAASSYTTLQNSMGGGGFGRRGW